MKTKMEINICCQSWPSFFIDTDLLKEWLISANTNIADDIYCSHMFFFPAIKMLKKYEIILLLSKCIFASKVCLFSKKYEFLNIDYVL